MKQKGEFQNVGDKKTKYAKFSKKTNISYPLIRTRLLAVSNFSNFQSQILKSGGQKKNEYLGRFKEFKP